MKRNLIKGTLSFPLPLGSGLIIGMSGYLEAEEYLSSMARPDPMIDLLC